MSEFDEIIHKVLEHEGGFTDDKDDPGNWTGGQTGKGELKGTKYGISAKAYPEVNIKDLTLEDAVKIYFRDYWSKFRAGNVPDRLRHIYFDMCVNMGYSRAVKILQEACNSKNANKIDVDGMMGKMTLRACANVSPVRVRAFRVRYYADLISAKPKLEKYWVGWFRRSCEV